MRLLVVTPSAEWLSSAGARIRYLRLQAAFGAAGVDLQLRPVDSLSDGALPQADMAWFTKCHDRRAPILASLLRTQGTRVGVDVFDDYYSDNADPRFVRQRDWFRRIAGISDFLLCSTPPMAERLARLAPGDRKSTRLNSSHYS